MHPFYPPVSTQFATQSNPGATPVQRVPDLIFPKPSPTPFQHLASPQPKHLMGSNASQMFNQTPQPSSLPQNNPIQKLATQRMTQIQRQAEPLSQLGQANMSNKNQMVLDTQIVQAHKGANNDLRRKGSVLYNESPASPIPLRNEHAQRTHAVGQQINEGVTGPNPGADPIHMVYHSPSLGTLGQAPNLNHFTRPPNKREHEADMYRQSGIVQEHQTQQFARPFPIQRIQSPNRTDPADFQKIQQQNQQQLQQRSQVNRVQFEEPKQQQNYEPQQKPVPFKQEPELLKSPLAQTPQKNPMDMYTAQTYNRTQPRRQEINYNNSFHQRHNSVQPQTPNKLDYSTGLGQRLPTQTTPLAVNSIKEEDLPQPISLTSHDVREPLATYRPMSPSKTKEIDFATGKRTTLAERGPIIELDKSVKHKKPLEISNTNPYQIAAKLQDQDNKEQLKTLFKETTSQTPKPDAMTSAHFTSEYGHKYSPTKTPKHNRTSDYENNPILPYSKLLQDMPVMEPERNQWKQPSAVKHIYQERDKNKNPYVRATLEKEARKIDPNQINHGSGSLVQPLHTSNDVLSGVLGPRQRAAPKGAEQKLQPQIIMKNGQYNHPDDRNIIVSSSRMQTVTVEPKMTQDGGSLQRKNPIEKKQAVTEVLSPYQRMMSPGNVEARGRYMFHMACPTTKPLMPFPIERKHDQSVAGVDPFYTQGQSLPKQSDWIVQRRVNGHQGEVRASEALQARRKSAMGLDSQMAKIWEKQQQDYQRISTTKQRDGLPFPVQARLAMVPKISNKA